MGKFREGMGSAEKTIECIDWILGQRGFAVVGIKDGLEDRYEIGPRLTVVAGVDMPSPFVIIAETGQQDWQMQCALVAKEFELGDKFVEKSNMPGAAFYKVVKLIER